MSLLDFYPVAKYDQFESCFLSLKVGRVDNPLEEETPNNNNVAEYCSVYCALVLSKILRVVPKAARARKASMMNDE